MHRIADDVYQLYGFPPHMINMYLISDVLLDAGVRGDRGRILKSLRGHTVSAHALTHVHPDHQGATHAVCEELGLPLWTSETEVGTMERGDMSGQIQSNPITTVQSWMWEGPAHPVECGLREGDLVAGFTVIETPGHSPGHLAYFRERDRLLIVGDVLRNISYLTLQPGLAEPPEIFTLDAAQNRDSARKLADLNPRTVLFGHGPPLTVGARFADYVASLP
jgi:hydroxyacylglutathione hydrolase